MSTVNGDVLYDEYGEITQCSFNAELLAGTPGLRSLPGVLFVFPNCCHEVTPFLLAYRQKSGAFERFVRFFVRFSPFRAGLRVTPK